ncbi:MAG: hypothetical protein O2960_23415 [Verrucomicrobia bacterium]|nr:hypothetical protein [Verrucomicrobiota bacterium]
MAKVFSFASWNVEHFKGEQERVANVVKFVKDSNPDVFALYEVEGKVVFGEFVTRMPTHNFFITEGEQGMETLIGIRWGLTAFVSQRESFKSKIPTLRPGVLVTITKNHVHYSVLFLHIKSSPSPHAWGLRDDMIGHVLNLKKALDKQAAGPGANLICVGDLNTMGLNVTYAQHDMSGAEELARFEKRFAARKMSLLSKTAPHTWRGGSGSSYPPSNLDHAFASEPLRFKSFSGKFVDVRGWPKLETDQEKDLWIHKHSDHALLFAVVET